MKKPTKLTLSLLIVFLLIGVGINNHHIKVLKAQVNQLSNDLEGELTKLRINSIDLKLEEQEVIEKEIVEEIVIQEVDKRKEDVYEVTAYTAGYESTGKHPWHKDYGITASGEYVKEGVTIACPKEFAFGTVIEIEGIGERVCMDRGGAIKSGKLDLYIPRLDEALDFGRQKLKVWVKES